MLRNDGKAVPYQIDFTLYVVAVDFILTAAWVSMFNVGSMPRPSTYCNKKGASFPRAPSSRSLGGNYFSLSTRLKKAPYRIRRDESHVAPAHWAHNWLYVIEIVSCLLRKFGCRGWIQTTGLQVMSLARCRASLPCVCCITYITIVVSLQN